MKLNLETYIALVGSVEKWSRVAYKEMRDRGIRDCPLCTLFHDSNCHGCPIREKAGRSWCNGSPYQKWNAYWDLLYLAPRVVVTEEEGIMADNMLTFLLDIEESVTHVDGERL